jgi:flagellar L-ring protein precursor FlgH
MNAVLHRVAPIALALLATGCASLNPPPPVDVLPTTLPPVATLPRPAGPVTGSLFHTASYRPAFEDQRARLVGDLVTIKILEKIDAKQNSKSNVNRTSDVSGGITALPLVSSSLLGKLPGKTTIGAGYGNTFEGKGDTQSKNEFDSDITALVTDVLPNGHLVIAGEKQVGVNRSVDVLRFSGIVDPRRLEPGSIIDSKYVANVRVISRGLGEQAEAQAMGWLARAFNTITPF